MRGGDSGECMCVCVLCVLCVFCVLLCCVCVLCVLRVLCVYVCVYRVCVYVSELYCRGGMGLGQTTCHIPPVVVFLSHTHTHTYS